MNKKELLEELKQVGFSNRIINGFSNIKRENFISREFKLLAYKDQPLPLTIGSTISQPYTIAFMLNLLELKPNQKILEIGSGSGYVLALINNISKNSNIFGIEIIPELVRKSKQILKDYKNIKIINDNGSKGLKENALFDRILISASGENLPNKIYNQLKNNGILVTPVRNSIYQIKKINNKQFKTKEYPGFVFVPLVEEQ